MAPCDEFAEARALRSEGELSSPAVQALQTHLLECSECRRAVTAEDALLGRLVLPPMSALDLLALQSVRMNVQSAWKAQAPARRWRAWSPAFASLAAAVLALVFVPRALHSKSHGRSATGPAATVAISGAGEANADALFISVDGDSAVSDALAYEELDTGWESEGDSNNG